jgi:hypothetical protein
VPVDLLTPTHMLTVSSILVVFSNFMVRLCARQPLAHGAVPIIKSYFCLVVLPPCLLYLLMFASMFLISLFEVLPILQMFLGCWYHRVRQPISRFSSRFSFMVMHLPAETCIVGRLLVFSSCAGSWAVDHRHAWSRVLHQLAVPRVGPVRHCHPGG